jgi:hypothetical protein
MMLTGRVYNAVGRRTHRLRPVPGARRHRVSTRRFEIGATHGIQNAPLTNYSLMHALPRIAEQPADHGFMTEAHDVGHRAERARGQEPRARLPGRPRRQGEEGLKFSATPSREQERHGDNPMTAPKFRPLTFGVTRVVVRDGPPGVHYLQVPNRISKEHPARLTDRLQHWARTAPERTFMARRVKNADGTLRRLAPRHLTPKHGPAARAIAQGTDQPRPECRAAGGHPLRERPGARAARAGLPGRRCALSPRPRRPYSLVSTDYSKLQATCSSHGDAGPGVRRRWRALRPRHHRRRRHRHRSRADGWRRCPAAPRTSFADLLATPTHGGVDAAMEATGPDTIVKFLFTSGSTKLPKAVINTHRMWCANQRQMTQSMPVLAEAAARAGGLAAVEPHLRRQPQLRHDGRLPRRHACTSTTASPRRRSSHETLRNLREIAPTVYFNVPTGFEAIALGHEDRRRPAPQPALARAHVLLCGRRAGAAQSGTACTNPRSARSASASS